jgi:hypothetical protein
MVPRASVLSAGLLHEEWLPEDDDADAGREEEEEPGDSQRGAAVQLFNLENKAQKIIHVDEILGCGRHYQAVPSALYMLVKRGSSCVALSLDLSAHEPTTISTMAALGYVATGKKNRRYVLPCTGFSHIAIVEAEKFIFVYRVPLSGEAHSPHQIVEIPSDQVILGAAWLHSSLVVLTNSSIWILTVQV